MPIKTYLRNFFMLLDCRTNLHSGEIKIFLHFTFKEINIKQSRDSSFSRKYPKILIICFFFLTLIQSSYTQDLPSKDHFPDSILPINLGGFIQDVHKSFPKFTKEYQSLGNNFHIVDSIYYKNFYSIISPCDSDTSVCSICENFDTSFFEKDTALINFSVSLIPPYGEISLDTITLPDVGPVCFSTYQKSFYSRCFVLSGKNVGPDTYPIQFNYHSRDWGIVASMDSTISMGYLRLDGTVGVEENSCWKGMIKWVGPNDLQGFIVFTFCITSRIRDCRK